MKKCGKICVEEETYLDAKTSNENFPHGVDKVWEFEALGDFTSIRANNCVFKGKWCYEVHMFSNEVAQLGWVNNFITLVSIWYTFSA
jgi:hypothetical protein